MHEMIHRVHGGPGHLCSGSPFHRIVCSMPQSSQSLCFTLGPNSESNGSQTHRAEAKYPNNFRTRHTCLFTSNIQDSLCPAIYVLSQNLSPDPKCYEADDPAGHGHVCLSVGSPSRHPRLLCSHARNYHQHKSPAPRSAPVSLA